MNPLLIAEFFILLLAANGGPILATKLLGGRLAYPLDGSVVLPDGYRLLGQSKTWRGLITSLALTSAMAVVLGLDALVGLAIGGLSMAGDLISSFTKRRLGRPSSSRFPGLDQVPESLLPALGGMALMGLSLADAATAAVIFLASEPPLSRLLFRIGLRQQPY